MMTLNERIAEDMKTALKGGERTKLETLRTVRAQILELSKRGTDNPVTADDEVNVLRTAIKKRKEAIELYTQAGRMDLAEKESRELEIIQSYFPKQLDAGEIEREVERILKTLGVLSFRDFGKAMGAVMKELKGKAEGGMVQDVVKRKLGA
ncbi:MAG: GatB/YqeY domain-containing protein [Ignavibacteriales bacterium]|nr:GatB/YqeY domain-containing protein [Ignavibacteriales bacterium]